MTEDRKQKIAQSFSKEFAQTPVNISLTDSHFEQLAQGIYASCTEEKWNVFLLDNYMYWSRSWTDICIYKVTFQKKPIGVELTQLKVNRNPEEYGSTNLKHDVRLFKKFLGFFINDKFY